MLQLVIYTHSCFASLELTEEVSEEDHQPFPTLQHCLEHVDPGVGFNIEIKFPQLVEVSACQIMFLSDPRGKCGCHQQMKRRRKGRKKHN